MLERRSGKLVHPFEYKISPLARGDKHRYLVQKWNDEEHSFFPIRENGKLLETFPTYDEAIKYVASKEIDKHSFTIVSMFQFSF